MATPILSLVFSVLAFTSTISSRTRPNLLIPQTAILASTALSFSTSGQLPPPWDSTWALMMAVWISHSTSVLWIEEWHFWKQVNPSKPISIWKIWNNPRLIGTPLQAMKPISSGHHKQSLLTFTTYRLLKALTYLFIYIYILSLTFSPTILPVQLDDFSPVYETYFRRLLFPASIPITWHETLIRVIWTFLWGLGPYLTLETAHALFSVLFVVILRTDEPEEWPPLFGNISEAYNLRRFWGVFWHRLIARPYSNFGKALSRRREVVAFVVFGLSGLAHAATAWLFGDKYWWPLDVLWFLGCFVGGAVETVVLKLLERAFMVMGQEQVWLALKRSTLARLLGYCWVFLFLFWSVPKWQYPRMHCAIQDEVRRAGGAWPGDM